MSSSSTDQHLADEEAARWFSTFNSTSISIEDLTAFRRWREDQRNDEAYRQIEDIWRAGGNLKSDPAMLAAVAEAKARGRLARNKSGLRVVAAAGLAVALLGLIVFPRLYSGGPTPYETARGEQKTIVLGDGSRVHLDTRSRIQVRVDGRERRVDLLSGQALFDVVHDPSRPFRVTAGRAVIEDIGTRFNVRNDDGRVRVTLVEGSVKISDPTHRAIETDLQPGQQVTVGAQHAPPTTVDPAVATSWTSGRLIFNDISLAEATVEISRHSTHPVLLAAPAVADAHVTGTFDAYDTQAFVAAVTRLYDLSASTRADGSIVLKPGNNPKPT